MRHKYLKVVVVEAAGVQNVVAMRDLVADQQKATVTEE